MITGGRFLSVTAAKNKDVPIAAVNIDISISSMELRELGDMEIKYSYTVNYEEGVGQLKIEGVLYNRENDAKLAKEIVEKWTTDKKSVPQSFLVGLINSINYICSINSPLPLRLIDLAPPILPPTLSLNAEQGAASSNK